MSENETFANSEAFLTSVAIDNGGSKAFALRFDNDFKPVASARTGSLRFNTNSRKVIGERVDGLIRDLGLQKGDGIESLCGIFPAPVSDMFKKTLKVGGVSLYGEFKTSLAAAGIFGDGILAVCGTGVSVFSQVNGKVNALGGYGSLISDEGSGYYIARQAFSAAIHDYEGRGPKTALTLAISEKYGGSVDADFREAVFNIYKNGKDSLVTEIASITPVVVKAAERDEVAAEILKDAGKLVGQQVLALIRKYELPEGLPIAITGSVFKGNPVFFGEFKKTVSEGADSSEIVVPKFIPAVGAVMLKMAERNGGDTPGLTAENFEFLDKYYNKYTFSV